MVLTILLMEFFDFPKVSVTVRIVVVVEFVPECQGCKSGTREVTNGRKVEAVDCNTGIVKEYQDGERLSAAG